MNMFKRIYYNLEKYENVERIVGDEHYDEKTAERCLNRRYYKRKIKVLH